MTPTPSHIHERKRGVDVFCLLTMAPEGKGRWTFRLRHPPPVFEERTVYRDQGRMIFLQFAPGIPRWRDYLRMIDACGLACRHLVIANHFPVESMPEELLGYRHKTDAYRRRLMLTAATVCLAQTHLPLPRRSAILYDPDCRYPEYVEMLLPHATVLKVVTDRPEGYLMTSRRLMEIYGAPLLVTEDRRALLSGCLILAPGPQPEQGLTPLPIFGDGRVEHERSVGGYEVDSTGFSIPEDVDPLCFLSAAWRVEGIEEAVRVPRRMWYGGKHCPIEEIADEIRQRIMRPQL